MTDPGGHDHRGGGRRDYLELLRAPHVPRLLGGTLIGRLPNGMGALAIVLYVRAHGGGYSLAGVLSAVYLLTFAAGQPVLGRVMDRVGQPCVLVAAACASLAGFAGLAAGGLAVPPIAVAAVVVAGFATPPLESGLRALWPIVLREQYLIHTAYALDAASAEALWVAGPLLVVGAAAVSTEAALLVTGALGVAGTLLVTLSPPSRAWRGAPRSADWAGPLRSPGLRMVICALTCVGASFGVIEIAVVSYADARHAPGISGVLLAGNSVGSLCVGLLYGTRAGVGRLCWLVAGLAAGYLPLILAPSIPLMLVFAVLSGVFIAPVLASTYTLVDRLAPGGTVTEAFAWLVTAIGAGWSLGAMIAGFSTDLGGVHGAFAGSAPLAGLALVILLAGRRTLRPADRPGGRKSAPDTRVT